jgi:predicted nucleotidyltransferase
MNPVQTKEELENRLHAHWEAIRHFGVQRLRLFGSFKRNAQSEQSDVDFLVEFLPGKKTFKNFMGLAFLVEDLLQRRVELVTPESLSPYMKKAILTEVESVEAVS